MDDGVLQAPKTVETDKTPEIDGFLYEVYLRMSHMFVFLLCITNG